MIWLFRGIFWLPFAVTIVIFLVLFYLEVFRKEIKQSLAQKATLIVLVIFGVQIVLKIIFFYFYTKSSGLGQYLLKEPGYVTRNVWYIVSAYLGNVLIGAILLLLAVIAQKISKKTFFEKADFWIIFITAFVAGFPGVIVMLIGALILMILVQAFKLIFYKSQKRLSLTPFLLLGAIIVGILSSFSFYIQFLQNLKLI